MTRKELTHSTARPLRAQHSMVCVLSLLKPVDTDVGGHKGEHGISCSKSPILKHSPDTVTSTSHSCHFPFRFTSVNKSHKYLLDTCHLITPMWVILFHFHSSTITVSL